MKSSSRDSPGARACEKASSSAATASAGRARRKNSDLLNWYGVTGGCSWGVTALPGSSTPSSAQNRLVSGYDMRRHEVEWGSALASTTSVASSSRASDSAPRNAPYTSTDGGRPTSPATVTFRLAARSSGPVGGPPLPGVDDRGRGGE